jgi:glutamate---cysteine ligase / carboxylate-amine ligase
MGWVGEFTIGVEEEFQLVDASSRALRSRAREVVADSSERLQPELHSSQVETRTPVCGTLDELRAEVIKVRAEAAAAARDAGARLAAAGTHPFSSWAEQSITPSDRYRMLDDYYRRTARETVIFASHFHIGIRDPEGVVDLMNRVRAWIPPLLALSANSPFWGGHDTGFSSFRAELARRWPLADVPRFFSSRTEYEELIEGLVAAGLIEDATQIYWDVRPSDHYRTLEFRITDVAMTVDETVMLAGLV